MAHRLCFFCRKWVFGTALSLFVPVPVCVCILICFCVSVWQASVRKFGCVLIALCVFEHTHSQVDPSALILLCVYVFIQLEHLAACVCVCVCACGERIFEFCDRRWEEQLLLLLRLLPTLCSCSLQAAMQIQIWFMQMAHAAVATAAESGAQIPGTHVCTCHSRQVANSQISNLPHENVWIT